VSQGKPSDWALQAFQVAEEHTYGRLSSNSDGSHTLQAACVTDANQTARIAGTQL